MVNIFQQDDVKAFREKFEIEIVKNNVYFGRYSLLSVLYLFNAKKILFYYERILLKYYYKPRKDLGYNKKIDEKFALLAGLNIVYYLEKNDVNPIEILILQNRCRKATKIEYNFCLIEIADLENIIKANASRKWIKKISFLIDNELEINVKNKEKPKEEIIKVKKERKHRWNKIM